MQNSGLRKWGNQELSSDQYPSPVTTAASPVRGRWDVLLGIFVLQLSVSSVLASQGVIVSQLLVQQTQCTISTAFLHSAVFSATWAFIEPWCRRAGYKHYGADSRLIAGCGTLMMAMGLAATSLSMGPTVRIITFGVIGGAGGSMASSQCRTQIILHSPGRQTLGVAASLIAQALTQFLTPLLMVLLLAGYGVSGASLLQAALVLHGLAAALLLRIAPRIRAVGSSMQMNEYTSVSQQDDLLQNENMIEDVESAVGDGRPRNHMGVEIMPQILEEDETEEEGRIINVTRDRQSYRESWCPAAPLDIYQPAQQDSTVDGTSAKALLTPNSTSGSPSSVFDFKRPSCYSRCGAWTSTSLRRAWTSLISNARELKEVCKPSLFPALAMTSATQLVPLGVATLVPALAQHGLKLPRHEAAFALSVVGFGWFCTAVCTPCMLTTSSRKHLPLVYAIASCCSAFGLYLLAHAGSHDRLTIGCGVVGLAHGLLVLTSPIILRNICNEKEDLAGVSSISALLDRASAFVVLLGALICSLLVENIWSYCHILAALSALQACLGVAWLTWEIVKYVKIKLKSYKNGPMQS